MTLEDDPGLQQLAALWQQEQAPSLAGLQSRVRRAAFLNRLALAGELVVGTGGIVAGAWLAAGGNRLVGIAAVAFGAFGIVASLVTRRGAGDRDVRSVAEALETAARQVERRHRSALGGLWVCAAALVFAAIVAIDVLSGSPSAERLVRLAKVQAAAAVAIATALVIVGAIHARASRRLAEIRRLQEALGLR